VVGGGLFSLFFTLNCESYQKKKPCVEPPNSVNKENFSGQVWNIYNIGEQ